MRLASLGEIIFIITITTTIAKNVKVYYYHHLSSTIVVRAKRWTKERALARVSDIKKEKTNKGGLMSFI
jgi:hypothetical protein